MNRRQRAPKAEQRLEEEGSDSERDESPILEGSEDDALNSPPCKRKKNTTGRKKGIRTPKTTGSSRSPRTTTKGDSKTKPVYHVPDRPELGDVEPEEEMELSEEAKKQQERENECLKKLVRNFMDGEDPSDVSDSENLDDATRVRREQDKRITEAAAKIVGSREENMKKFLDQGGEIKDTDAPWEVAWKETMSKTIEGKNRRNKEDRGPICQRDYLDQMRQEALRKAKMFKMTGGNAAQECFEDPLVTYFNRTNKLGITVPPKDLVSSATHEDGRRLMIKQIIATNFKSYHGEQVIGPFHPSFTTIVGPNGSGKSNVIDALLFVFGFKASKIRSKNLSVLIHSSSGREDIQWCKVEIQFQMIIDKPENTEGEGVANADGIRRRDPGEHDEAFDVVPNSEFTVARIAFKDNSSKYYLNDRLTPVKEIAKKLRSTGLDLVHNRFLILQGEVEHIALMKPKGMLEYLEDIIGSSRFKEPLREVAEQTEKAHTDFKAQESKTQYAEREKAELEGPVKELITCLRTDNAIALVKNKILHRKLRAQTRKLEVEKPNFDALKAEKDSVDEELARISKEMTTEVKKSKALEKEKEELEKEADALDKEEREIEGSKAKRDTEMKRLKEKLKKKAADLENLRKKLADTEADPETLRERIEQAEATIKEMDEEVEKAERAKDDALPQFTERTAADQKKRAELEKARTDVLLKENAIANEEDRLKGLRRAEDLAKDNLAKIDSELNKKKTSFNNLRTTLNESERALAKAEQMKTTTEEELKGLKTDRDKIAKELSEVHAKLADEKAVLMSSRVGGRMLEALMREKKKGRLPGVYGRLGDLGAIDEKYDVAISTTCGSLDHIIVDNADTAQACVRFLKENNLGVATFVCLDKQKEYKNQLHRNFNWPAPRVVDLIQVKDEELRYAFYYALTDTLVVDHIEQATKVAFGGRERHRVITLRGEIVDPQGMMTGGGQPQKGRIGTSVRDTVREMEAEKLIESLSPKVHELEGKQRDVERNVDEKERLLRTIGLEIAKHTRTIRQCQSEIENMEQTIAVMEKQRETQLMRSKEEVADEEAVRECEEKLAKLKKELEKAKKQTADATEKVKEADDRVKDVHRKLVQPHIIRADECRKTRKAAMETLTKSQANLNNQPKRVKKVKHDVEEAEAEVESVQKEMDKISDDGPIKERVDEISKRRNEIRTRVEDIKDDLTTSRLHKEELAAKETEKKSVLLELKEKVDHAEERVKAVQHECRKTMKEIGTLKLVRIPHIQKLPEELLRREKTDFLLDDSLVEEKTFLDKTRMPSSSTEDTMSTDADEQDERLPALSNEEVDALNDEELEANLLTLTRKQEEFSGHRNMNYFNEYVKKLDYYNKEMKTFLELEEKHRECVNAQELLDKMALSEFMIGFCQVGLALKIFYFMMTRGGNCSLDLVDHMNPFQGGISFMVRPRNKSWKQISHLSGGEKTLASLSLVFALHHYRPTPLYVMDEIDAALDFRNVSLISGYIKKKANLAQFIVISLRNNMYNYGKRMIGIYKTNDCTFNVVLEPRLVQANVEDRWDMWVSQLPKRRRGELQLLNREAPILSSSDSEDSEEELVEERHKKKRSTSSLA